MKSLQDLYFDIIKKASKQNKEFKPHTHKSLSEAAEEVYSEAKISVKFQDDPEIKQLTLPDAYARKVLGYANVMAENAESIIKKWVRTADWGDAAEKAIVPVLLRIFQDNYDLHDIRNTKKIIEAINDLIEYKDKLRSFHKALISDNNNFYYFLELTYQQLPSTLIFNSNIIKQIKKIVFAEGGVAVGEGEVLITLFSEATNPKKGDLEIKSVGEVELKGPGGRAGKGTVISASASALKEINKFLVDNTPKLKEQSINEMFNLTEPFYFLNSELSTLNPRTSNQKKYVYLLKALFSKNKKDVEKIITGVPAGDINNMFRVGMNFVLLNLKQIDLDFNDFKQFSSRLLKKILEFNFIKIKGNAVNFTTFFNLYKDQQAIDMLAKFSHKDQNGVKQLIYNYIDKLRPDQIAAAIQVAGYQESEDFKFIVYFNKDKILSIGPFTNNYIENLNIVLQKADKFRIVSTNLGGDASGGGRGGFNVTI